MHVAQRFELFLDKYRRPDGGKWTGQLIGEATGGVVTRSYVTNLRKGRLENHGYEKMRAMARARTSRSRRGSKIFQQTAYWPLGRRSGASPRRPECPPTSTGPKLLGSVRPPPAEDMADLVSPDVLA